MRGGVVAVKARPRADRFSGRQDLTRRRKPLWLRAEARSRRHRNGTGGADGWGGVCARSGGSGGEAMLAQITSSAATAAINRR